MQLNTGQTNGSAGRDLNVIPVWMQGITGKGVVVSVVDDGKSIFMHCLLISNLFMLTNFLQDWRERIQTYFPTL